MLLRGQIAPQPLHTAAHDHQEIVEVVRDAAGQLSDRFQALRLSQRGLRGLPALRFDVQPSRTPQGDADDDQQEQRCRQAENQMTGHGRVPLAADRRAVDARDDVDRKTLELAEANPIRRPIDLGVRDRVDHAFPGPGHRLLQSAPGRETGRAVAHRRVMGEKFSIRLHQRKEASRAAPDQRVEVLEVARQHRDRDDAIERAVRRGAPS